MKKVNIFTYKHTHTHTHTHTQLFYGRCQKKSSSGLLWCNKR